VPGLICTMIGLYVPGLICTMMGALCTGVYVYNNGGLMCRGLFVHTIVGA